MDSESDGNEESRPPSQEAPSPSPKLSSANLKVSSYCIAMELQTGSCLKSLYPLSDVRKKEPRLLQPREDNQEGIRQGRNGK